MQENNVSICSVFHETPQEWTNPIPSSLFSQIPQQLLDLIKQLTMKKRRVGFFFFPFFARFWFPEEWISIQELICGQQEDDLIGCWRS